MIMCRISNNDIGRFNLEIHRKKVKVKALMSDTKHKIVLALAKQ